MRRDVRSLGRLLGEVLKEQVGDKLFSAVEELRLLLIEHRELHVQPGYDAENERRLIGRAERIVSRLDVGEAHQMAKAFAIYFELTNLAENNHRNVVAGLPRRRLNCWPNQDRFSELCAGCVMPA